LTGGNKIHLNFTEILKNLTRLVIDRTKRGKSSTTQNLYILRTFFWYC